MLVFVLQTTIITLLVIMVAFSFHVLWIGNFQNFEYIKKKNFSGKVNFPRVHSVEIYLKLSSLKMLVDSIVTSQF